MLRGPTRIAYWLHTLQVDKNWLWPAANQSQLSQQVKVAIFEEKNWVFKTTCWRALIDLIILSIAKVHLAPFSKRQDHNVGDDHTSDRPVGMVRSAKWPNQEEIGGEIKVRLGYALVLTLDRFLDLCSLPWPIFLSFVGKGKGIEWKQFLTISPLECDTFRPL